MTSITMPQLGESVTEGTIARWLKREGESVAKYEPLVEVITDKVNSEIPSPEAGTLARIVVPEGQTVKVGTEIATVEVANAAPSPTESTPVERPAPAEETAPASTAPISAEGALATPAAPAATSAPDSVSAAPSSQAKYTEDELRRRSSPLVRRLAKEHGVDLSRVAGSGTGGRVTKEDMLAYIASAEPAPAAATAAPPPSAADVPAIAIVPGAPAAPTTPAAPTAPSPVQQPVAPAPAGAATADDEEALPISPVRRAIAEHMVRSVTTAPHAWTYVEIDASGLVAARAAQKDEFSRREGFDLTYVPFVAKALVESLRQHPILNSTWRDGQVVLKKRIHLGVAVALEDGLVVPVIRDADERSIAGLARTLNDLVTRARQRQLKPDDVQGGTFTLNNTGALGSILSMPIINQPQAAILTMEAITKRVVVTPDDAIAIRPMLNLCISFDHRVCDGLPVMRFLQTLKQRLEAISASTSLY
jgi:2-oxoisovalerate dehydrogenase E2 component (dihydrolipoyl transacylase)